MSNRTRLPLGDYYQLLLRHGLLADAAPLAAGLTHPVSLVSCDSKLVIPNTLFVCKGVKFKEEYLRSAMEQGAFAYVSEREYPAVPLPCIRVTDIRQAMGLLADRAYGHPSGALRITGITGTKGKTTTAYYIKSIVDTWLAAQGHRESALLSTIVTDDGLERKPAKLTTPEPLDLQRHLSNAVTAGADYLTMEVSSQALKYGRVIGVDLSCAVFLNIGEDHISPVEHPDLEDYLQSKLLIFRQAKTACISMDCDHAPEVAQAAARCEKIITFSQKDPAAVVYGTNVRKEGNKIAFHVRTPRYEGEMAISTPGLFNVENALAAVAVAEAYGISREAVEEGLEKAFVPGRMEHYVSADNQISVIVDYSHNGMSLQNALQTHGLPDVGHPQAGQGHVGIGSLADIHEGPLVHGLAQVVLLELGPFANKEGAGDHHLGVTGHQSHGGSQISGDGSLVGQQVMAQQQLHIVAQRAAEIGHSHSPPETDRADVSIGPLLIPSAACSRRR